MTSRIEDYALLGDCETAALVSREGSIDWLCWPRFDSGACFAALLGTEDHGRWLLRPEGEVRRVRRRYREGTLILETEFETDDGKVALIDFMPLRDETSDVMRIVESRGGKVPMRMELVIRFDYGSIVPWVRDAGDGVRAIAGPNALHLRTPVALRGEEFRTVASFEVAEGERVPFTLSWHASHKREPEERDAEEALEDTERWWREWSGRCAYEGPWKDAVVRSLVTLKALTYAPTGGLVAAPTTSLPESLGGVRNWDYRYCWLRDATFTLYALMVGGYQEEAAEWREWLLRAVAGHPSKLQIMYGVAGERRLDERHLDWLPGYARSTPVREGNAAWTQQQLDVYGEVMDALHFARRSGLAPDENAWRIQRAIMDFVAASWQEPDNGIWEVRGPKRHFTHSRVMAWVAADRAVKAVERWRLDGPVEEWKRLRKEIHSEVCERGFHAGRNTFVQHYGTDEVDASLLMIPLVGFLPATDPRVEGTIEAVRRELMRDGFVMRYPTCSDVDGLPPGEGAFLACTLWLADNLALSGKTDEATELFERVLRVRNDVGLLAEEYEPSERRLVGNFPQAISHLGIVNTARNLSRHGGPAEERPAR
ncbi:MAG TPA: glycoside hydrolase family 15 protein [Planctomycetota bacterium]|nr:glycoside hydrolase family 15 protein [Planctomycetota bacterium]